MAGTQTLQGQRYWHTVRVRLHVWENMEVNKFRAVVVRWRLNSSRWIIERQCVSSQWWLWSKIIGWRWCNESSCLWHLCARLMGSGLFLIAVIGPWQRETYFREQAQPTASEQKKQPKKMTHNWKHTYKLFLQKCLVASYNTFHCTFRLLLT